MEMAKFCNEASKNPRGLTLDEGVDTCFDLVFGVILYISFFSKETITP